MYKRAKIGIDLGATFIKMGLVDEKGKVYFKRKIPTQYNAKKAELIDTLIFNIKDIIKESGDTVLGVGIGVPGPCDSNKGIVHYFPNIKGWKEVPLKFILKKRLGIKVELDNDANVMALGEYRFGAGKGARNIVCITLGTGIGGGIIMDGKLYRGSSMVAGEIGNMPINEKGPFCSCGGIACLQRYIGNRYILNRAMKRFGKDITLEKLTGLAAAGNKHAIRIWEYVGKKLAVTIAGILNLLNPDRVVIGGGVSRAGSFILRPLKEEIKIRAMSVPAGHVKICLGKLGNDAGIIGASLLVRPTT